jgi:hypothetical protein
MATKIYKTKNIYLFDGTEIEIMPLKIKYLREFMDVFDTIKNTKNDDEAMMVLLDCTRVAMKQYFPEISKNIEDLENNIDLPTIHEILDLAGNIKIGEDSEDDVKTQAQKGDPGPSWEDFDLAKLESEVFLLGIWKDYNELEEIDRVVIPLETWCVINSKCIHSVEGIVGSRHLIQIGLWDYVGLPDVSSKRNTATDA